MTTAGRVHIDHVEDREGDGLCTACQRHGLRWVVVLSDGRAVGIECAKGILGFTPRVKDHLWQADYALVATYRDTPTQTYALWQHVRGTKTCDTVNGSLQSIGGARAEWERRGWL